MKHICFTIRNIDCGGGTERVGLRLANALVEHGYAVSMVSYDAREGKPFFCCDPRIKLWTILSHGGFERKMRWHFWYGSWKFRRFLKREKVNVVIDIDSFNAMWTAKAVQGLGIKWISWDHFNFAYTNGKYRKEALRLVQEGADCLVLLSKADRETYLRETTFKPDFLKQIYNPLSFEVDHPIDHRGQKKVLAMGNYIPVKGFDLLIRAWKIVEQYVSDWSLEIVCGSGDFRELENEAHMIGCNRLVCSGPITDVQTKMSNSAIFALSSRFEGFGLVITEAASCSVPTVSFNCSCGPKEIITGQVDGLLVEPENYEQFAEKLIWLIRHDEERARMGQYAYENSKRFSMERILKKWVNLIDS